jgi:hypothetical protein
VAEKFRQLAENYWLLEIARGHLHKTWSGHNANKLLILKRA